MAQYASSKHVPQPELAVTATGAAPVRGGASILLGVKPKLGAAALIGFLAGVSPIMHDFWREQDPNKRMEDMIQFTKNMAPGRYDGIHGCRRAVARPTCRWLNPANWNRSERSSAEGSLRLIPRGSQRLDRVAQNRLSRELNPNLPWRLTILRASRMMPSDPIGRLQNASCPPNGDPASFFCGMSCLGPTKD